MVVRFSGDFFEVQMVYINFRIYKSFVTFSCENLGSLTMRCKDFEQSYTLILINKKKTGVCENEQPGLNMNKVILEMSVDELILVIFLI